MCDENHIFELNVENLLKCITFDDVNQDSKQKKHATIVMDEFQLLISFNFILSQEIYERKTLLALKLNMVSSHVN